MRRPSPLPPALSPGLDAAAEAWWRLLPRTRLGLSWLAATVLVAALVAVSSRSPWGPAVPVLVAAEDLAAGAPLGPDALVRVQRPAATVPDGAAGEVPTGARLRGVLPRGAVLTRTHVAAGGIADGLTAGRVAVALPADALPPVVAGQRLDLLAGEPSGGAGRQLATDIVVLAVDPEVVWVEVERASAADVVAALAWGDLGVALLPGVTVTEQP